MPSSTAAPHNFGFKWGQFRLAILIQALDRTAPILPYIRLGEKATSDYLRHGTTSLFAALEVLTGK